MASPHSSRNEPHAVAFPAGLAVGRSDAVARLVEDHEVAVFSFLRTRVGSASEALGICLEVLVAVARRTGGVASDQKAIRRQMLEQAEKQLQRGASKRDNAEQTWLDACRAVRTKQRPGRRFSQQEARRVLADLEPSQQQVLQLRYGADLSNQAIGERLHRSETAVQTLLDKARRPFATLSEHLSGALFDRAADGVLTEEDAQQLVALVREEKTDASAAVEAFAERLELEEFLWLAHGHSRLSVRRVLKRIRQKRFPPVAVMAICVVVLLLAGLYRATRRTAGETVALDVRKPSLAPTVSPKTLASPDKANTPPHNQRGLLPNAPPAETPHAENPPSETPSQRAALEPTFPSREAAEGSAEGTPWAATLHNDDPPAFRDVCFDGFSGSDRNPTRVALLKWLRPASDATGVITETRRRYGRTSLIRGVFRLQSPWRDDAGFRFEISPNGVFQIHAFQGETGVSFVQYERNGIAWAAYKVRRTAGASKPIFRAIASTDEGRANRTGAWAGGPYEMRWRQGRLLLLRGDVVVLAAPMERRPEEAYLEGQATVEGFAMVKTSDFPGLPNAPAAVALADKVHSLLPWREHLADGAHWRREPGEGNLERPGAGEQAWVAAPMKRRGPFEALVAISNFSAGAGVCVGTDSDTPKSDTPKVVIRFHKNTRGGGLGAAIVHPSNKQLSQAFPLPEKEPSPWVGERAWLRFVFGCGVMKCWIGVDGQHWAELGSAKIADPIGWIGLYCSAGESACRIQLDRLVLRDLPNLNKLASPAALDASQRFKTDDFSQWKKLLSSRQPAELDEADWLRASALASLSGGCAATLGHSLLDALLHSAQETLSPEQFLAVLAEAALLTDADQRGRLQTLLDRYHRLGRRMRDAGERKPFSFIRHAMMTAPLRTRRVVLLGGEDLKRAELLSTAAFSQWEEVAWSSKIFQFFHLEERVPLQPWAAAMARRELGAPLALERAGAESEKRFPERWRHPGNIPIDRRAYDIAADLDSLVASKSWSAAARRIAALDLSAPRGLAPREKDLFISPLVLAPSLLRGNERLRQAIQQEAAEVALFRVRQAIEESDVQRLTHLAAQFASTQAALLAHRWLGDDALSRGAFAQARTHYRNALAGANAQPSNNALLARLQLARAYLIKNPSNQDDPTAMLSAPVRFGESELSSRAFNAMVENIRRRTFSNKKKRASPTPAPEVLFSTQKFALKSYGRIATLSAEPAAHKPRIQDALAPRFARAPDMQGRITLFSSPYALTAFNMHDNRLIWSDQTFAAGAANAGADNAENRLLASSPALFGGSVFIRRQSREGVFLVAYELESGKIQWVSESSPNHQIVSDPVVFENQVIGITAKLVAAEQLELFATHWDRDSGALLKQHKLLDLRAAPVRRLAAGLVQTPSGFLAGVGGCLIAWETEGRLLWIRRQFMAPPEDVESWNRSVSIVRCLGEQENERFTVSQPGSPDVCCVDHKTGALIWRRVFPELTEVVGQVNQSLLVREKFSVHALNRNNGDTLWSQSLAERAIVSPAASVNAVAVFANIASETRLQWLDATTGAQRGVASVTAPGGGRLHALFDLSGRLFGVLLPQQTTRSAELAELLAH